MNEHVNGTPLGRDQHWSVEQAARRLRMTEESLSRLIASGTVKTVKRGPLGTRGHRSRNPAVKESEGTPV